MKEPSFPIPADGDNPTEVAGSTCSRPLPLRFVTWCVIAVWRTCVDWRTKRPLLTRATAHLSIIILALLAILVSGIGIPAPQTAAGGPLNVGMNANAASSARMSFVAGVENTPPPTPPSPGNEFHPPDDDTISRLPVPHTTFPDRLRLDIVTYVVQEGDTIFDIAAQFGLMPDTIVWSNREAINDAPWLIQPGLELFIPPVDGVYHTVRAGETAASIADEYDVEMAALYNEWNGIEEGQPLREGQLLIVPGGQGEEVSWTPPPRYPSPGPSGYSYGICSGATFSGPGANGWFIYPTGSSRVSGWYFHDPRNPTHIGIDYACNLGDALYAADNGVVTIAGWSGGYGILVEVNHGNGFITRYGHFNQLAVGCGQSVYQGDLLGYCGSTGWSTGPHLHFEIRHNGVPQNPQAYLP